MWKAQGLLGTHLKSFQGACSSTLANVFLAELDLERIFYHRRQSSQSTLRINPRNSCHNHKHRTKIVSSSFLCSLSQLTSHFYTRITIPNYSIPTVYLIGQGFCFDRLILGLSLLVMLLIFAIHSELPSCVSGVELWITFRLKDHPWWLFIDRCSPREFNPSYTPRMGFNDF